MSSSSLSSAEVADSLLERVESFEQQMSAIREGATVAGRALSDDEREQLNQLSIARATAYREWQQERNRAPSPIITGPQIFKQADRKRQWQRLAVVVVLTLLLGASRYQRYADRQAAADAANEASYSVSDTLDDAVFTSAEELLLTRMPSADLLPAGFTTDGDWAYDIDEIAWEMSDYGSDAEASEQRLRLTRWGFESSVYRSFELDPDLTAVGSEGLFDLDIDVTELAAVDHAIEMVKAERNSQLNVYADDGEETIDVGQEIGDFATAVREPYSGYGARLWWMQLWVVDGPFVYQFWTVTDDDGMPDRLLTLARETIGQAQE